MPSDPCGMAKFFNPCIVFRNQTPAMTLQHALQWSVVFTQVAVNVKQISGSHTREGPVSSGYSYGSSYRLLTTIRHHTLFPMGNVVHINTISLLNTQMKSNMWIAIGPFRTKSSAQICNIDSESCCRYWQMLVRIICIKASRKYIYDFVRSLVFSLLW